MKKRGITGFSSFIAVAVLVASLSIIIIFFFRANLGGLADREACIQSIEKRSSGNFKLYDFGKNYVPLNCKTERTCIRTSDGQCSSDNGFGVSTSKSKIEQVIVKDKDDAKQVFLETLADSIVACHDLIGKGNLDFTKSANDFSCSLCKRVVVDAKTSNKIGEVRFEDLYKIMESRKVQSGESQLKYVYGVNSVDDLSEELTKLKNSQDKPLPYKYTMDDFIINVSEFNQYAIIVRTFRKEDFVTFTKFLNLNTYGSTIPNTNWQSNIPDKTMIYISGGTEYQRLINFFMYKSKISTYYSPPIAVPFKTSVLRDLSCASYEFSSATS